MKEFEFVVKLDCVDEITTEIFDKLFDSGCDDGTLYSTNGKVYIIFDREGESFQEAYESAVDDIVNADIGFVLKACPKIITTLPCELYSIEDDAKARSDFLNGHGFNMEVVEDDSGETWLVRECVESSVDIISNIENDITKRNKELADKSRTEEEVIKSFKCTIDSIVCISVKKYHTPDSERMIGGSSPSYYTGTSCTAELKISGHAIVKNIRYCGPLPLESGDEIIVYIYAGEYEYGEEFISYRPKKKYLIERDLKETEEVLKIEKLCNNIVVATYM